MYQPDKLADLTQTTPVDPFSLDALIAWLRTKPGDEEYDWADVRNCLLCQYGMSIGRGNIYHDLSDCFENAGLYDAVTEITCRHPRTFGAALSRAIAYRDGAL